MLDGDDDDNTSGDDDDDKPDSFSHRYGTYM